MIHLPTLRQMQYLIALADHGGFARAAQECAVTQSTLSGGIKDMEELLRNAVIDRTNRRNVRLTPLGEEILLEARDVVSRIESLTLRARQKDEALAWPLRMGIIPTIAPYLLPRFLKPLQTALPALELHIHEMRSAQIVEKLNDGGIDFALMAFPYDTKDLHQHPVYTEKFVCAAPPGAFPGRKQIGMKDLEDEKMLLLEDGHCLRDHALAACKFPASAEARTLSAASLATLKQLVSQGYGLTLLPEMAVANNAALPRGLRILPFSSGAPTRQIGFAWKKSGFRQSDIALVIKQASKILKEGR